MGRSPSARTRSTSRSAPTPTTQVPLELTGDPTRPVTVRADADGDYKIGTGPTWRLGKKMLGATVPMRFHAGEPFHAGLGWQMMEAGLKGMSTVLAD